MSRHATRSAAHRTASARAWKRPGIAYAVLSDPGGFIVQPTAYFNPERGTVPDRPHFQPEAIFYAERGAVRVYEAPR